MVSGEFEPKEERSDRELTLGPVMLLSMLVGLLAVCGLCFGFGYATGRRGTVPASTTAPPPGVPLQVAMQTAAGKPAATSEQPCQPQQQVDITSLQPAGNSGNVLRAPTLTPQNGGWQAVAATAPAQGQVRPALQQQAGNAAKAGGVTTQGAPPGPVLMVQVAAVSRQEDANVLMSALRKRGYGVVARREPSDGLIHVQIGPFTRRSDAEAMSQRLLSDGYNALVVP